MSLRPFPGDTQRIDVGGPSFLRMAWDAGSAPSHFMWNDFEPGNAESTTRLIIGEYLSCYRSLDDPYGACFKSRLFPLIPLWNETQPYMMGCLYARRDRATMKRYVMPLVLPTVNIFPYLEWNWHEWSSETYTFDDEAMSAWRYRMEGVAMLLSTKASVHTGPDLPFDRRLLAAKSHHDFMLLLADFGWRLYPS